MQAADAQIGARTRFVCVLGHPVGHSLSPRIHNAAFRRQGVDMAYAAFDVPPGRLPAAVQGIRALGMRGANITVPHKEAVAPMLDEIDELAERVGAVNTIVNDDGSLSGYNTDVGGFIAALRSALPGGVRGETCVLAGAGGAARAVVAGLVEEGAAVVWLYNRSHARAQALCEAAAAWGPTVCKTVDVGHLPTVITDARLLVNATPTGLPGMVKEMPFPVDTLNGDHIVIDLAYGPQVTTLVQTAREIGAVAMDGKEMLIRQAAASYRLWTGLEAPIEVMRASIEQGER